MTDENQATQLENKLGSCPFCGRQMTMTSGRSAAVGAREFYNPSCEHCNYVFQDGYYNIEDAIKAANSRAPVVAPQEDGDDGSAEWCDDCHGYTHKYDCPSKRYETKTPLVDRVVDAVYRSMARYESGEWWLDTLKAKARVKRLLSRPGITLSPSLAAREAAEAQACWVDPDDPRRVKMIFETAETASAFVDNFARADSVGEEGK